MTRRAMINGLGKIIALILVLALVLLIERYCTVQPEPFGPDAEIVSIDGDSLRAGNGEEYRIFGIDAPELHQSCEEVNGKDWLCGRAAKVKLTKLIKGGNVACDVRNADRYGRNVAVCSAEGVPDLGEAMVREATPSISVGNTATPMPVRKQRPAPRSVASGAAPSSGRPNGARQIRATSASPKGPISKGSPPPLPTHRRV
ncbi:hypothetical protein AUC69_08355 [Methyloceanibacter superfactus]|uniref:TNase-like domain-containing protein n=2 Tax=Methyloceanibacter superfactus TaxID=1774969 RepID=A0A1E3W294_9HYPH|nr:hypothetical protein AUC69_08355 [Methyloceanibacter superfactus]